MTTTTKKMAASSQPRQRPSSININNMIFYFLLLLLLFLFSSFSTATSAGTTTTTTVVHHDHDSSSSSDYGDHDFLRTECLTAPVSVFKTSVRSTIEEVRKVTSLVSKFTNAFPHDLRLSNAIIDCLDQLDLSAEELSWTLSAAEAPPPPQNNPNRINNHPAGTGTGWPTWKGKAGKEQRRSSSRLLSDDLRSWLSAALGNQDTCIEGFESSSSSFVKHLIAGGLKHVTSLVSDVLGMVRHDQGRTSSSGGGTLNSSKVVRSRNHHRNFPSWMQNRDRRLLQQQQQLAPPPLINNSTSPNTNTSNYNVDVVVAGDGSGNFSRIMDAVLAAPDESTRRFVIYIKRGLYIENVDIKKKKWNLMMIGDGMDATVISSNRSFIDGWTTFRSATFAVSGRGFIARDLTIENTAGAVKHQAVALRSDSDLSAFYRCGIKGYQDTLYAHSLRQFYRECRITGTVDFIFGNGAVVFQNCQILARKPLPDQKNSITAQGRKDPNQNTGFSIQFSNISADSDLLLDAAAANSSSSTTQTYLGRPWKQYSRTIFMQSYMGSVIRPEGWLEWQGNFALDTLYYGEYMNYGPGAGLGARVKWPGFHAINESSEANNFTVAQFIDGASWLPSTGVKFTAGLVI